MTKWMMISEMPKMPPRNKPGAIFDQQRYVTREELNRSLESFRASMVPKSVFIVKIYSLSFWSFYEETST